MEFTELQKAIATLQNYSLYQLDQSKENVYRQSDELEVEKVEASNNIRRASIFYQFSNESKDKMIQQLAYEEIPRLQRQFNSPSASVATKKAAMYRLTKNKLEHDRLEKTKSDDRNLLKQNAKVLLSIYREIDKIKVEILFLEKCKKIFEFLKTNQVAPGTIADSDMFRLYKDYMKGG